MKIGWYSMQIDPEENFVWFDARVTNNMIIISSNSGNSAYVIFLKNFLLLLFLPYILSPAICLIEGSLFNWYVYA